MMDNLIRRDEFIVTLFDTDISDWVELWVYPNLKKAKASKEEAEREGEKVVIRIYEIVERDELKNLLTKTRTCLKRKLVATIVR